MPHKRKRSKSQTKAEKKSNDEPQTIVLDPVRYSDEPVLKKVRQLSTHL